MWQDRQKFHQAAKQTWTIAIECSILSTWSYWSHPGHENVLVERWNVFDCIEYVCDQYQVIYADNVHGHHIFCYPYPNKLIFKLNIRIDHFEINNVLVHHCNQWIQFVKCESGQVGHSVSLNITSIAYSEAK